MIKKYKEFLLEKNVNEGFKDWLASFMLLFNVGAIPLNITTANAQTKKEFIESQPESKLDAAKFVDFINKQNSNKDIKILWNEFILKNKVNSSLDDVNKYLSKDGKNYNFDKKYKSRDFSNIDIHKIVPTNYLTDAGNFIADSLEPKINNFIYDYEKKTSVEICILTVPTLNGEDKHDYSLQMFNKIGVGKSASNNGILIMVSMEDRKWQIITGYGVEGLLPDLKCSRIGNDIIKTNFKKGDYYSGIMGSLEEIKKTIDKNPQEIQKLIDKQSEVDSVNAKELWTNIGIGALILAMIATVTGLVYKKWSDANEMMDDVSFKLKDIKLMRNNIKKEGIDEIDELYTAFINLVNRYTTNIDKLSKSEEKPKFYQLAKHSDFIMNQKKRASELSTFHDLIRIAYDSWNDKKVRLNSIKSTIRLHSLASVISNIDYGFNAWEELSDKYGVKKDYDSDKLKSDASKLDTIIDKLNNTYKTSIRDAEKIINDYNNSKNSILYRVSDITSLLSKYKTAEDKINNWKRLVDSALSSMNYFKRWSRTSEVSEIEDSVEAFSKSSKKDLLDSVSRLETLISEIDSMSRKWRRRKEDEEEEEERKRRAASSSSYSSSSSSSWDSGGSSFGGFGGGSSGGGGAGGDW